MLTECSLRIGCFLTCADDNTLTIEIPAAQNGTHVVEYHFLERVGTIEVTGVIGNPIEIPVQWMNESGDTKIRIKQPDGEYISVTNDGTAYTVFIISVKPSTTYA